MWRRGTSTNCDSPFRCLVLTVILPSIGAGPRCTSRNLPAAVPFIRGTSEGDVCPRSVLIDFRDCVRRDYASMRPTSYDRYSEPRSTSPRAKSTLSDNPGSMHGPWIFLPTVGEGLGRPVLSFWWTELHRVPRFSDGLRGGWEIIFHNRLR